MTRDFSGWGVTVSGLLLAAGGVIAMWSGWDMIVVERGWSLFIAGAVAVSGGLVTIALGRVIVALSKVTSLPAAIATPRTETAAIAPPPVSSPVLAKETPPAPAPAAAPPPVTQDVPDEPAIEKPPPTPRRDPPPPPPVRQRHGYSPSLPPLRRTPVEPAPAAPEPKEVDRYTTGGATYVMMSDGSVEVRGPEGVRRYASLAELKAETAPTSR